MANICTATVIVQYDKKDKKIGSVEIDNKELILEENESTFIPLGSKHRLSNKKNKPLIIIEVQSGEYLGEDDIVRFNDNYGRK